ncbi:MAG: restriction endonuclease subunit S [Chthoniobacterales bacterium]
MSLGWKPVRLGDLVETQKGYAFKSAWYSDSGRPIVKVSDFTADSVDSSALVCIPEATAVDYLKYKLETGDVVIQTVGSWPTNPASVVGKCVRIPPGAADALLNQNAVKLSPSNGLTRSFLYYRLRSDDFKTYIIGTAQGAASQAAITLEAIRAYNFDLPPLPVQRRIASILSAYDELMENCQRRVRILGEMARALYREWFVHFRFPGHEKIPRVDSPLGPIPKGWDVKKLAEVADVNRAQINARTAPDELHYIDISSVSPGQIDAVTTYSFSDAPGRARRIVQHGDTLWSCVRPNRRSHALLIQPLANTIASTGFAVLTPKNVPFPFLYLATTTDEFVSYLTNLATGAAYPAVTATTFQDSEVIIPPSALLEKFAAATIPMAEGNYTLRGKIKNLRDTRDLLLPRLLSGRLCFE